ncbi:uncharacterized protein LOC107225502 isoform X1 [Neodiprion lecontei]|uniref:Uncharacterized protein LOC107225502 isoform X1 n=1 Tax=Neodiprion lecontei TaxID=441921 RepID=A0ABM3G643_NEOLC|nr:uncharacterized protein LOC107225502 isoform X1 [Neodiprion lecontei]
MKSDVLLVFIYYGLVLVNCQTSIPERLEECYRNGSVAGTEIPTNLRVLIDLIQKAEHFSYTRLDMRATTSSLLHRFRFDGIEHQEDVAVTSGISPFSGTGFQREKHKIIEELVPGDYQVFPSEALTLVERCTLHRMISSTIWEHPSASVEKLCSTPSEKVSGRSKSGVASICPVESGVIITPYGTISPGAVIASIAASLQPQNVAVKLLIAEPPMYRQESITTEFTSLNYNEKEVDLIVPKGKIALGRSMWFQSLMESTSKLDNVWVSTLAGDIGEMAVYQGPVVSSDMTMGATGFWNSTMQPRLFYLTDHNGHLDATRAEIVGGIDGLVIGKNLQTWIDSFHSLRLSQVLDMYYSYEGIAFDKNAKACQRLLNFQLVAPTTIITEQTHALAQILAYRNSIAYMTPEALLRMVNFAVNTFSTYADNYLFAESECHNPGSKPQLEILVAFDGAWSRDYTADFISVMLEDLDVSMYGSRMGLLHGKTGEWLVNVTHSPSTIYYALKNFTQITWPSTLNLARVLEEVGAYLNETWSNNSKKYVIGNLGQVVVLLAPRTVPSEEELQSSIQALRQIKTQHPDVRFVYYGSEFYSDPLKNLILTSEDYLIKSLKIDDLSMHLRNVPRVLRPPSNFNLTYGSKNQFEDYTGLQETVTYQLHPQWRGNTKKVEVTFHSVGYGAMRVCSWNEWPTVGTRDGFYCQDLRGHNEISMTDYSDCRTGKACPKTYYRVQNVTTMQQCSEMDCKTPNHVRYIVRIEDFRYVSCAPSIFSGFQFLVLYFTFIVFSKIFI